MSANSPQNYVKYSSKSTRNESMECWKMIAAFLVVFNHASFPGTLGSIIVHLGGFAVPIFFMICGYFNFQATSEQVARRTKHIAELLLIGTLSYIVWGCIATELEGGSSIAYLRAAIPDPDEIVRWLILHVHPYAGHLWYLNASIAVYLVFYVYTRFANTDTICYRPFYILCLIQFAIVFAMDTATSAWSAENVHLFARCGWFAGLPMFGAGLFLREHQERIFSAFSLSGWKLVLSAILGAMLTILQGRTTGLGVLPFGTLIGVVSIMLFLVSHPVVPIKSKTAKRLIMKFGPISTWIYIVHLIFVLCYERFLLVPFTTFFGEKEPFLYPLLILCASIVTAVLCEFTTHLIKKHH